MATQARRGRGSKADLEDRGNTRDNLLRAAEEVVIAEGAQALTLDAVHKRAGVSKGGLLYHFPSKEALLDGMIERYVRRSESEEEALKNVGDPNAPGAAARATIAQLSRQNPGEDKIGAALLAAVATDLDRLAPVRTMIRQRFDTMKRDPIGFETAAIVDLAVTGLAILELLKLPPLSPSDRRRVLEALNSMVLPTKS